MAYQVALTDSAKADSDSIYRWVISQAPGLGRRWFEGLLDALYSLEQLPRRCPLAREAEMAKRDIRCLLFGKRRGIYRILYEVQERRNRVWILHIRHGALRDLEPDELTRLPRDA